MLLMALGLSGSRASVLWISASCRIHLSSAAMNSSLPDRWTEYSTVGKRIPGTRFIAFKVPLKKLFDNKLAPWQRFSAVHLVSEIEKQNEELGLVVDLTCTKRYYSPQELPATVKYIKIFTAGQQVPNDHVIHEFKSTVKTFLSENSDNDKLVGVHCTHGLNRTGYLVCRYMIDVLGMVPSEAIEKFNKSRGHCMERKNYLDDLIQGKPKNNAGAADMSVLSKTGPQHHVSRKNVNLVPDHRPALCRQEQPWFPGHPCSNPSRAARSSAPQSSHPPQQYNPMPQYGFQQTGGRLPGFPIGNGGPRIPTPTFPRPPMPGQRHHIPPMRDNQQQRFRGGRRHHHNRPFSQQHDRPVNHTPMYDPPPHVAKKYGGSCTEAAGPQQNGHNKSPYRRWRGGGGRGNPRQQWQ